MAEEMIESAPWEAEEAYGEAEESIEAEESGEDYRSRRRQQQRRPFQAQPGVSGLRLRSQDGQARTLQFPAKLATASETNRGLAAQELGRRALDDRLEKLEQKFRSQLKKDIATTGVVTLAIGGGLSAVGAFQVANHTPTATSTNESVLKRWANRDVTKMATVASLTQLATSGAKLAFNGRYVRSGFGIAADVFSVVQLGLFTFGALQSEPAPTTPPQLAPNGFDPAAVAPYAIGTRVFNNATGKNYIVIATSGGNYYQPL